IHPKDFPRSDAFCYYGHPTIFPASFISSMDSLQSFISSLLSSSGSSPPLLPHQHFLSSDNVQLAPGSSHRHSALQRSSWLVSKGEMYHSILFLKCFLIHLPFKSAVFPTPHLH
ncbi:hypothetical protein CHARACLAT_027062, partial [Characodon lateralis]|nr:hypothetical protein [Characodon lateralis]